MERFNPRHDIRRLESRMLFSNFGSRSFLPITFILSVVKFVDDSALPVQTIDCTTLFPHTELASRGRRVNRSRLLHNIEKPLAGLNPLNSTSNKPFYRHGMLPENTPSLSASSLALSDNCALIKHHDLCFQLLQTSRVSNKPGAPESFRPYDSDDDPGHRTEKWNQLDFLSHSSY